jgi:hypothetical protein
MDWGKKMDWEGTVWARASLGIDFCQVHLDRVTEGRRIFRRGDKVPGPSNLVHEKSMADLLHDIDSKVPHRVKKHHA